MSFVPASYLFLVLPAEVGHAEGGLPPILFPVSVVKSTHLCLSCLFP